MTDHRADNLRYGGTAPRVDWVHVGNKHLEPPKDELLWIQFEGGLVATGSWRGWCWAVDGNRVLQHMEVQYWAFIDYPEGV